MKWLWRVLAPVLTAFLLLPGTAFAVACTTVYQLDPSLPGDGPHSVTYDSSTGYFYVTMEQSGTVYRGRLGDSTLTPFLPGGQDGRSEALGVKVRGGRIYIAGGFTDSIFVYDLASKALVARFDTGPGGDLEDLVITPRGDVFVTDALRPILWHLSPGQVSGAVDQIPVSPEIQYLTGDITQMFNMNGLTENSTGDTLWATMSNTGDIWRIHFPDPRNPHVRQIQKVSISGGPFGAATGILLDQGYLLIVQLGLGGFPAQVSTVQLSSTGFAGTVVKRVSDPSFNTPERIARAGNSYLVTDGHIVITADGQVTYANPPWTVSGLPVASVLP